MLKSILLFLKSHAIATGVITTVIVGSAGIGIPIAIESYNLDKNVKENLSLLEKKENILNNESKKDEIDGENNIYLDKNEPLTFKIEKVTEKIENVNTSITMEGTQPIIEDQVVQKYKIVPNHYKDPYKWTKKDKEAYSKAVAEVARLVEEEYKKQVYSEEQTMADIQNDLINIEKSYSKDYTLSSYSANVKFSQNIKYNTYKKGYLCSGEGIDIDRYKVDKYGHISKDDFRNTIYPTLKAKLEEIKNLEIGFEKENNEKLKEDFRISTEQFYKQKGIAYNWNPNGEYESQNLKSMEEEMNNQVVNIEKHFESQKIVLDEIYHLSD